MRLTFLDPHDPYYYAFIGSIAVVSLAIYYFIWKWNGRVANFIVFFLLSVLLWWLVDWDYALNTYFKVNQWRIPSN